MTKEAFIELQNEHEELENLQKKTAEEKRLTGVALSTYREDFLKNNWHKRVSV